MREKHFGTRVLRLPAFWSTWLLISMAILALAGCATVGRKINTADLDRIRNGKTTRQEVLKSIGSPDQVRRDGNGNTTYIYKYARHQTNVATFIPYIGFLFAGSKTQNQTVIVSFGPDDVVRHYTCDMGGMESGANLAAGGEARIKETEENKREK